MALKIEHSLDLRGRSAEEVAARTRDLLRRAPPGALVEVVSTETAAAVHLGVWSDATRVELLESSRLGPVFRCVFRKGPDG